MPEHEPTELTWEAGGTPIRIRKHLRVPMRDGV